MNLNNGSKIVKMQMKHGPGSAQRREIQRRLALVRNLKALAKTGKVVQVKGIMKGLGTEDDLY